MKKGATPAADDQEVSSQPRPTSSDELCGVIASRGL
jgi:hypothetical protein